MLKASYTQQGEITDDFGPRVVDAIQSAGAAYGVVAANRVQMELAYDPGPVVYPIQWTSERQRRAFFATNGFGKGIPYQRTGATMQAWKSQWLDTKTGGELVVENPVPSAKYVYGSLETTLHRQPFHRNTGWPFAPPIVSDIFTEAENRIIADFIARSLDASVLIFKR